MRTIALATALLILTTCAFAQSLDSTAPLDKPTATPGLHPGTPDGREGGETIADAIEITTLPFFDTGNTSDNMDDYDAICPYGGSTSPDVVYRFVPTYDIAIRVDLCGSGYDTKVYILDPDLTVVACNDDHYMEEPCGMYVSLIEEVSLFAGQEYFIVIDGYGGDSGDYELVVRYPNLVGFCELPCSGVAEEEPELVDGYVDVFNTGCNADGLEPPFTELVADENGDLVFCGVSGWFEAVNGAAQRDTDWLILQAGDTGLVTWTLDAQEETHGFRLGPQDCDAVEIQETITTRCESVVMSIEADPGEVLWLWVGPSEYTPPGWFGGHEYEYVCTFTGLAPGVVDTEPVSLDAIKSLYR